LDDEMDHLALALDAATHHHHRRCEDCAAVDVRGTGAR
jgi:hypothetical protein